MDECTHCEAADNRRRMATDLTVTDSERYRNGLRWGKQYATLHGSNALLSYTRNLRQLRREPIAWQAGVVDAALAMVQS